MEWRDIPGFEGYYEVSEQGDIRSRERVVASRRYKSGFKNVRSRVLKPYDDGHGYLQVSLYGPRGAQRVKVHSAVASAFLGPRPHGSDTRHLDGDSRHNHFTNLQYGTRTQNVADAISHGTFTRGERNGTAKFTNRQVSELKRRIMDGGRTFELAREYGVSPQAISDIKHGRNWAHVEPARGF